MAETPKAPTTAPTVESDSTVKVKPRMSAQEKRERKERLSGESEAAVKPIESPRMEIRKDTSDNESTVLSDVYEKVKTTVASVVTGNSTSEKTTPKRNPDVRRKAIREQHAKRMKAAEKFRGLIDKRVLPFAVKMAFEQQATALGVATKEEILWTSAVIGAEPVYCGLYVDDEGDIVPLELPFALAVVYNAGAHALELAMERLADVTIDHPVIASVAGLALALGQVGWYIGHGDIPPVSSLNDEGEVIRPGLLAPSMVKRLEDKAREHKAQQEKAKSESKTADTEVSE